MYGTTYIGGELGGGGGGAKHSITLARNFSRCVQIWHILGMKVTIFAGKGICRFAAILLSLPGKTVITVVMSAVTAGGKV